MRLNMRNTLACPVALCLCLAACCPRGPPRAGNHQAFQVPSPVEEVAVIVRAFGRTLGRVIKLLVA